MIRACIWINLFCSSAYSVLTCIDDNPLSNWFMIHTFIWINLLCLCLFHSKTAMSAIDEKHLSWFIKLIHDRLIQMNVSMFIIYLFCTYSARLSTDDKPFSWVILLIHKTCIHQSKSLSSASSTQNQQWTLFMRSLLHVLSNWFKILAFISLHLCCTSAHSDVIVQWNLLMRRLFQGLSNWFMISAFIWRNNLS